jgi:hypothetical protein
MLGYEVPCFIVISLLKQVQWLFCFHSLLNDSECSCCTIASWSGLVVDLIHATLSIKPVHRKLCIGVLEFETWFFPVICLHDIYMIRRFLGWWLCFRTSSVNFVIQGGFWKFLMSPTKKVVSVRVCGWLVTMYFVIYNSLFINLAFVHWSIFRLFSICQIICILSVIAGEIFKIEEDLCCVSGQCSEDWGIRITWVTVTTLSWMCRLNIHSHSDSQLDNWRMSVV